ncbi:MAG: hypothetical protein NVSMB3_02390 [Acidobacteriaceae bacterium]
MAEINEYAAQEQGGTPAAPMTEAKALPEEPTVSEEVLRSHAATLAMHWQVTVPGKGKEKGSSNLEERLADLEVRLKERLRACKAIASTQEASPQLEFLESTRALEGVLTGVEASVAEFQPLPHVRVADGRAIPRIMNLAEEYLSAAGGVWSPESLAAYVGAVQRHDTLLLGEILLLPAALKLAQTEFLLDRADEAFAAGPLPPIEQSPFSAPLHSLRRLNQFEWHTVLEPLVPFQPILCSDPDGVFSRMEEENRDAYRLRVAELAHHADASEMETAQTALDLAREAAGRSHQDPRVGRRVSHIGYYLFEEGFTELSQLIGYHPPFMVKLRSTLITHNEDFYILGIFLISVLLIVALIAPLVPHNSFVWVMVALFLALLPATQGAADLVNNAVTALLHADSLPKLDLSEGIPAECTTMVVIPTLLLSEAQVRETFDDLEARYLSNQDPNLHFGVLTDLPDSESRPLPGDRDRLLEIAVAITDELNAKYAGERGGSFVLLHRHRIFNARQGVWMGWERKRGKLLDLNKLLLGEYDSFPVKAGPMHALNGVRYVITLDSDTQLPRGTAARMIGTMAHPLNHAIVNPRSRIVTAGYGILQPRVGVSVASASRSRLAALYSGETGFDIYTRAVSDVYQDLFGEGIFTGKGIYEVGILHQVLDRRFPRNALLSHDLIEGAYARAGLVTDIEVIDDYPSHHSAHTRRRHRWVRGDWQITQWLSGRVPDESGRMVANPISTISRWKIFDNLRRSLVEPVTFLLLVSGWMFLPGGPLYWTIITLTLLLLPVLVQLGFNLGRAALKFSPTAASEGFKTFFTGVGFSLLNFAFLPHQMLLAVDAILRSLIRRFVTGKRLLEWETAAQSEVGRKKTSLDRYLQISPALSIAIAAVLFSLDRHALLVAAPILLLWAAAPAIAGWLNSPPRREAGPLAAADQIFLESQALRIWRYFSEFGGEANHGLIPDNVEEKDLLQVRKLSPTNLGMLFNTRQAALELGFLTLPEFTRATLATLATYDRLEKKRGHIYNWYDIETLQAIAPLTISAVDSGNLLASLYTVHGGALDLLTRPLLEKQPFAVLRRQTGEETSIAERAAKLAAPDLRKEVERLAMLQERDAPGGNAASVASAGQEGWAREEVNRRRSAILSFVTAYAPWLLPRFRIVFELPQFCDPADDVVPSLKDAVAYAADLSQRVEDLLLAATGESAEYKAAFELRSLLAGATERLRELTGEVSAIAAAAEAHANAMEFGFLLVKSRQLLSIGYDGPTGDLHSACYDLLASEARIASFLAVAKGDIPQQSWFRLDRSHVLVNGRAALLSWTGTMFEYLMPALWMRNYPDTLIARTIEAVVQIQREHVRGIPWGISESGFAKMDPQGRYGYQAWGIPAVALKYGAEDGPVISPYSTFLTLPFARKEALSNLRRMASMEWSGEYGFYEAADYTESRKPQLVRSWMAHHQGMSLLAVTNLLRGNVFQRWFHANPRVRAAELLLHERPLAKETLKALAKQPPPPAAA